MTQLTYFLITRKLFDSPIWRGNPHILKLFIYLIGRARFLEEPKRFQGFDLKRGELLTSLSEIADDNEYLVQGRYIKKWSRQKVSRMLTHLQNNEYIDLLSDTYGTHISIRNYDQYQLQKNYKRTPVEHQRDTSGTPVGIYKQDKNDKKDKKKVIKEKYSEFVFFTKEEKLKLDERYGSKVEAMIEVLNNYIGQSGKVYKSHYHVMLGWVSKKVIGDIPLKDQQSNNFICKICGKEKDSLRFDRICEDCRTKKLD